MSGCGCNMTFTTDDDFNIYFPDGDGGGAVKSVNGKTGAVVLDAGDIGYDETAAYAEGSVGAEIKALQEAEVAVDDALSDTSENPVQNKVITEELDDLKAGLNNKADIIISSASGSIAHFEDGANYDAVDVVAHLEPVQDLHGQDAPYPAGGGKNKLPLVLSDIKTANTEGTWNENAYTINGITYTLTETDGYVSQITVNGTATGSADININTSTVLADGTYIMNGCPSGGTGTTYYLRGTRGFVGLDSGNGSAQVTYISGAALFLYIHFASGVSASNLVFKPMIRLSSVTDATFAPYSNICPITGHTGVDVVRTGVNVWDEETQLGYYNGSGVYSSASNQLCTKNKIRVKPGQTYRFNIPVYQLSVYVCEYTATEAFIIRNNFSTGSTQPYGNSYTVSDNCHFITVNFMPGYGTTYNHDISINYPSTDTAYHAYDGAVYPITFPSEAGTVYGGYVDVTNGKLVVDRALLTLNTANMNNNENFPGWANSGIKALLGAGFNQQFQNQFMNVGTVFSVNTTSTYDILYLPKLTYGKTQDEWKALAMDVQVLVELATTIEYDLTPQAIELLKGTNNLWTGNGDTSVEYKADTKLYIEQLTKPTEDDMTANTNIASGKFFMVGNRLFISTAVIASGDTIKPNTNCTEMSLADALNSL